MTVSLAVLVMDAKLADMFAKPVEATAEVLTVNVAVEEPPINVTRAGTPATAGESELRATVNPAGAGMFR